MQALFKEIDALLTVAPSDGVPENCRSIRRNSQFPANNLFAIGITSLSCLTRIILWGGAKCPFKAVYWQGSFVVTGRKNLHHDFIV